jgi:hypothetical protein
LLHLSSSCKSGRPSPCVPPAPSAHQLLLSDRLDQLEPTHRGLHRFQPRHKDEIEIDIGDPVYVQKEAEDLWCEGANLRTGLIGIFPLAHVVDVEYNDFDPNGAGVSGGGRGSAAAGAAGRGESNVRKERYLLEYIGCVSC